MNESEIPIDIHTLKLQDWLISRRIVQNNIQAPIKDIRIKITNALQDMPSNEQLINLLAGTNINYYHVKTITDILKQTEKDTKSVFGIYGSQRMKDWQEISSLYEKNSTYLAEAAQIYVRNINYEIPGVRKQMIKLEQQFDDCLNRADDLEKPESQLLSEHSVLLQQLGVKGENLHAEFVEVLAGLPELYKKSIENIGRVKKALDIYAEVSGQELCLPILRHMIEFGNTTVYQYIHKEAPLAIEEPELAIKLSFGDANAEKQNNEENAVNEIDFGTDDNGGTSSTVSAEMIDFGDFGNSDLPETEGSGNIDWGIETSPASAVEISFDIPIEEFGIVVEGTGMDGGIAKGDQAYTLLDSPNYRDRFLDEIYELEAFLRLRFYELESSSSSNKFSLMENIATHDSDSIGKLLSDVEQLLQKISDEQIRHLFQLKHSPNYADLMATKLQQMTKAVEKLGNTREALKKRAIQLRDERVQLNSVLDDLIAQTQVLQTHIEKDISKRYKNRVVNLIGGIN